jgi:hypothetical protein
MLNSLVLKNTTGETSTAVSEEAVCCLNECYVVMERQWLMSDGTEGKE